MTFWLDVDVSSFPGHAGHAVPDLVLEHDASADAGSEREKTQTIHRLSGAEPVLAEGCRVRIVLERNAGAEAALDLLLHGIIGPARKVGRLAKHSPLHINDSWNADSYTGEWTTCIETRGQCLNRTAHLVKHFVASGGNARAGGDLFDQLAAFIDRCDAQVGAAKVNADGESGHAELE